MIKIITDNGSDITAEQAEKMGIELVPLVTAFEDGVCPLNSEADYNIFYSRLRKCDKLPVTSRPSPQCYYDIFERARQKGDEVLVLTLSSGLSGTYESALVAKDIIGYDKIIVVDTQQAVMSQRLLVEYAVRLRDKGTGIREIADAVCHLRSRVRVMGVIDTLVYLKKGGRIPSALAVLGNALNIKPIITVEEKIIRTIGKARGRKLGISMLYKQFEIDGFDESFPICYGFTSNRELGETFMQETNRKYGIKNSGLFQVSGIIGTHLGTDCFGLAYVPKNAL